MRTVHCLIHVLVYARRINIRQIFIHWFKQQPTSFDTRKFHFTLVSTTTIRAMQRVAVERHLHMSCFLLRSQSSAYSARRLRVNRYSANTEPSFAACIVRKSKCRSGARRGARTVMRIVAEQLQVPVSIVGHECKHIRREVRLGSFAIN